jgi:hypothetical protein
MILSNDKRSCLANKIRLLAYKWDMWDDEYRNLKKAVLVWLVRPGDKDVDHPMALRRLGSRGVKLGSKNHDRDERLAGACVHCKDSILVKCACRELVLIGAGDVGVNSGRHAWRWAGGKTAGWVLIAPSIDAL